MAQQWDYDDKKGWTQESYLDKASRVWITGEDSILNRSARWLQTQREKPKSRFEQTLIDASDRFYEAAQIGPAEDHAVEQTTKGMTNLSRRLGASDLQSQVAGASAGFLVGMVIPGPGEAKALVNLSKIRKLSKAASKVKNIEHSLKGEHLLQAGRSKTALKSQLSVKNRIAEWLPEQVKNSGSIDDVKRAGFGTIVDEAGDVKEVQGLHRYWSSVQEGKPDPKLLTFVSRKSRIKGAIGRINRMQAPEEALKKLAKETGLPDEVVEKYLKSNMRDFGNVQEAARLQGLTVRQRTNELGRKVTNPKKWKTRKGELNKDQILYDAGHWRGTESLESPIWKARGDELGRAPTSGYAARIEAAKKNRAGSGKIEHDINPLAAREAGIPRTWEEDFLYFADREMGYNLVPDWKQDFSGETLEMIEAIPYNADQAYVNKVFKKIAKIDRKKSIANPLKPHKRDLRIEKNRRPGKNEEDLQWLREQLNEP